MKRILHDVGLASWRVTLNSTPTLLLLTNIPKRVVQPENISYFNITWWQTGKTKGILLFATILGTSGENANLFWGDFEIHKPWHYGSIIIPVREEG